MFEKDDYVWAEINGYPTQLIVMEPRHADGLCKCFITNICESVIIPEDQLHVGNVPDEPSYFSRRPKRRKVNLDCFYDSESNES